MRCCLDEIAELSDALDRLRAALNDLAARGLRIAGSAEIARLSALRDEFRTAGAAQLASRVDRIIQAIQADERSAAPLLLRTMAATRLFDRMLTLEAAAATLQAGLAEADSPDGSGET